MSKRPSSSASDTRPTEIHGKVLQFPSPVANQSLPILRLPPNQPGGSALLNEALRASEQRLSKLLQDRDRIRCYLHDGVLKSLHAIGLSLDTGRRLMEKPPQKAEDPIGHAAGQLNRLVLEIRELIFGLQSETVQGFQLEAELQTLARTYQQAGGIRIDIAINTATAQLLTLEEGQQITYITREALSNTVRHGHACRATISLRRVRTMARFEVADDGVGFRQKKTTRPGYGLNSMKERARQLGGRLLIDSHPRRGTRVILCLSIKQLVAAQ